MVVNVLDRPTLVLNKCWQPVDVQTVAETLSKVWSGSARVVDPQDYAQYTWDDWTDLHPEDGDPSVQLVGSTIRVPEVITLADYKHVPRSRVSFSRKNLFTRDNWTCQYCGCKPGSREITMDHVVPRAQGGKGSFENCVAACVSCNHRKADRTPKQARMKLMTVPKTPEWGPTFRYGMVLDSWEKFVSERDRLISVVYWNVPLEE